jgi:predicted LPLAT superfamily acyltransferase
MGLEQFAGKIELPRSDREAAFAGYVQRYADTLEAQLLKAPLQWFNFFDFWSEGSETVAERNPEMAGE